MHSHRSRSAFTVTAAVAVALVAPLLTGCGTDAHPGAAAVVEGDRISVAQLQSQVRSVRDAQRAHPESEQMIRGSGQLTRATLDGMIRNEVVRYAADEAKVSVSRREVQRLRARLARQAGGEKEFQAVLLRQQAIAPSEIDDRIRLQLTVDKVAKSERIDPRTPDGNARLSELFARTSSAMSIDVNPRFGTWDSKKASLANSQEPWLRDLTGQAADRAPQM